MLFNHLNYNVMFLQIPDGGLQCVSLNTRGLSGSVSTSQISRELTENNNIICLQVVHGKDSAREGHDT